MDRKERPRGWRNEPISQSNARTSEASWSQCSRVRPELLRHVPIPQVKKHQRRHAGEPTAGSGRGRMGWPRGLRGHSRLLTSSEPCSQLTWDEEESYRGSCEAGQDTEANSLVYGFIGLLSGSH